MGFVYSDKDGILLVKLARRTVDAFVTKQIKVEIPADMPSHLMKMSGVFVTLNILVNNHVDLRGCIGRPYPTQPLAEATRDSAIDAAVHDPRFSPVRPNELDSIVVELSVLTPPEKLNYERPEELLELVEIGRDGLIVSKGLWRGLLLPQVPVEWGWDTKEFLEHTCNKAGLPANAWKDPDTEFMAFQAEIFGETEPHGEVIRNPTHQRVV
ncbi:MAG: TIGR00296 family protein [Candidatus Thorarchaeota archaeon]|nr:TIGR00296 family protein [Candidatus Thorarchaeota archaeon]